jgi:hypothetical protein
VPRCALSTRRYEVTESIIKRRQIKGAGFKNLKHTVDHFCFAQGHGVVVSAKNMLNEHERQLIHAAVTKFPTAKALNLSNNGMSLGCLLGCICPVLTQSFV